MGGLPSGVLVELHIAHILSVPHKYSQMSPVLEFRAAITFFSVATMSFLEPWEASKEANLSFPTYCCLLGEKQRAGDIPG